MTFKATSIDAAVCPYDALLIDAYGVLVDHTGPLPGAAAFLKRLRARAPKPTPF